METIISITAMVASISTCVVSCFYAWLAYKRSQKDELWETAIKLALSGEVSGSPDDLLYTYEQLLFYKHHPDLVREHNYSVVHAMLALKEKDREDTETK